MTEAIVYDQTPATPPCQVTPIGQALWRELAKLCGDLCLVEWSARQVIETALKAERESAVR